MFVETLQVEITNSSLGLVLIAASARGVKAVLFGETEAELEAEFTRRFGAAKRESATEPTKSLTRSVLAKIENPHEPDTIPLDPAGTPFQQDVWNALTNIPAGETVSYKQLATQLGRPRSVRAVANACAANPIAVLIPCHRVIATTGNLTGYRWGLERKRQLLTREHLKYCAVA